MLALVPWRGIKSPTLRKLREGEKSEFGFMGTLYKTRQDNQQNLVLWTFFFRQDRTTEDKTRMRRRFDPVKSCLIRQPAN